MVKAGLMRRISLVALSIALTTGAHTGERRSVHRQHPAHRAPKPITQVAQAVPESAFPDAQVVTYYWPPGLCSKYELFLIGGKPGSQHLLVRERETLPPFPSRLFDLGALAHHPGFDFTTIRVKKRYACFHGPDISTTSKWAETKLPDRSVVDKSYTQSAGQSSTNSAVRCDLTGIFTDGSKDPTTGKPYEAPLYEWSDGN